MLVPIAERSLQEKKCKHLRKNLSITNMETLPIELFPEDIKELQEKGGLELDVMTLEGTVINLHIDYHIEK